MCMYAYFFVIIFHVSTAFVMHIMVHRNASHPSPCVFLSRLAAQMAECSPAVTHVTLMSTVPTVSAPSTLSLDSQSAGEEHLSSVWTSPLYQCLHTTWFCCFSSCVCVCPDVHQDGWGIAVSPLLTATVPRIQADVSLHQYCQVH